MRAYIIKHTKTGAILPQEFIRGGTYWDGQEGKVPRLFPSRKSAQCFAQVWVKGFARAHHAEMTFIDSPPEVESLGVTYEDQGRRPKDIEILCCDLVIWRKE